MPNEKYKIYTYKEFAKIVKYNGYSLARQTGSHSIWIKKGCNPISIPANLNPMIARRLIKENNLKLF